MSNTERAAGKRTLKSVKLIEYLHYARCKAAEGHLPLWQQLAEMALLFGYRRLGPGYYLFGRFWRREIPLRDKLRHLNERAYARKLAEINDPIYGKLSQYKVAEKALLTLLGLPTPAFLGLLQLRDGRSHDGKPLVNGDHLESLLIRDAPAAVFFKPIEGWGGRGVVGARCHYPEGAAPQLIPMPEGKSTPLTTPEFVASWLDPVQLEPGYIVEHYCQQHPWYAALNPTSVNTVRLYVIRSPRGAVRNLGGYLRVGRAGSIVDSASRGGLLCPLDPATGITLAARFDRYDSEDLTQHPDTGAQLEGLTLPYWKEVDALAAQALTSIPFTHFAGVDVAVTAKGPCVIEINVRPDRTAACDLDLPTLDMLDNRSWPGSDTTTDRAQPWTG